MVSKEAEELKQLLRSSIKHLFKADISYVEQRESFSSIVEHNIISKSIKVEETDINGVPCLWVYDSESTENKYIIHFHGGYYGVGTNKDYIAMAGNLVNTTGARVLLPNYRQVPEYAYPAGIDDSTAVYEQLLAEGYDAKNIAFSGDSGGGGILLAVLLNLRDRGTTLPSAGVLMSPITDLTCTNESYKTRKHIDPWLTPELMYVVSKQYIPDLDPKTPLASPFYADLKGLPPLLIHVGDCEILLDDSRRFAQKAKEEGVNVKLKVWDGLWHIFHLFTPKLPEANRAFIEIGDFLNDIMKPTMP